MREEIERLAELMKRPENDDDYAAFVIGSDSEDHRMNETEVSFKRCVPLKSREKCPHGWASCDLAFYTGGAEFRLNGLVASDLEALAKALEDYAHRLRNY